MRPDLKIVPEFYQKYVKMVPGDSLTQALLLTGNETFDFLSGIHENLGDHRYAAEKWSIKELIAHLIDAERIMAYRALRFSRNDQTPLSGFEENEYAPESNAGNRKLHKILAEFTNLRASTLDLFSSFSNEMLARSGTCNGVKMSVLTLGYVIVGHELHHMNILKERYLKQ